MGLCGSLRGNKMDTNFIINKLKARHPSNQWIFAAEVPTSTGHNAPHNDGPGGIRRIDAFALNLWPSKGFQRVAYEIKVSRGDWLAEIRNPIKRSQAWHLSNEFWFAVPAGIIERGDWRRDMAGCGVLTVYSNGIIEVTRKAHNRKYCHPMPIGFVASLTRCVRGLTAAHGITY